MELTNTTAAKLEANDHNVDNITVVEVQSIFFDMFNVSMANSK